MLINLLAEEPQAVDFTKEALLALGYQRGLPTAPGWYPAVNLLENGPGYYRHWNGTRWSKGIYWYPHQTPPSEKVIAAKKKQGADPNPKHWINVNPPWGQE